MPLDDEAAAAPAGLDVGRARSRLGGLPEVALAPVFLEGHSGECARSARSQAGDRTVAAPRYIRPTASVPSFLAMSRSFSGEMSSGSPSTGTPLREPTAIDSSCAPLRTNSFTDR